jgi:hypothetical protein
MAIDRAFRRLLSPAAERRPARIRRRIVSIASAVGLLMIPVPASAGLINGDFETGDLTGWTTFVTLHGGLGSEPPAVVLFDTNGDGIASNAARFQVGQVSGNIGGGAPQEGGGVLQSFVTGAGELLISVDIAAEGASNASAGLFSLLFDHVVVDTHDFGDIGLSGGLTIERSTLSASTMVTAGSHEMEILMTRGAGIGGTPYQYLDDVIVSGSALSPVPEPSSITLLGVGLLITALSRSRRAAAPG